MKKTILALLLLTFGLSACSMPRLVKVDQQGDPTATMVVEAPEEIEEPTQQIALPTDEPFFDGDEIQQYDEDTEPLFFEDFDQDDGSWNSGYWDSNTGYDEIKDGEYLMTITTENYMLWSQIQEVDTADVILEADLRLVSGSEENGAGFVCRFQDEDNFYMMFIGNDGYYSIEKYVDGIYANLKNGMAEEGYISSDYNHLEGECSGNSLGLWVNGGLLAYIEDSDLTEGGVGLYTRSFDEANITIGFDNFGVFDANSYYPWNQSFIGDDFLDRLLFYDDFESSESDVWDLDVYQELDLSIVNGWLTYAFKIPSYVTWDVTGMVNQQNVLMEAYFSNDAVTVENLQGFVCRYQDNQNFYFITFGNDGYVLIGKYLNGERIVLTEGFDESGMIDADFNLVQVTCQNELFSLFVNNELVAEVEDPQPMLKNGDVGFFVGSYDDPKVELSMDDFVVLWIE